jgi:hypothetical protein
VARKTALWHAIAVALSAVNLVAAGFALPNGEPWHVATHVVLAVVFGAWARRLRRGRASGGAGVEARLGAIDAEVVRLRQELGETQERLDFAERMLAQRPDARRVDPRR